MELSVKYAAFINWLSGGGAVPDTVMHIHGGMIVLLAVRLLTGRSLATPWPLLAVVIAAFGKELADYLAYDRVKPDSLADIINTVFWPAVLFVGLRIRRAKQASTSKTASDIHHSVDTTD
tara:strand:- start:125 stop:484 length:360 start_codon:yes stop_codon:yes gene_type:complete